MRGLRTLVQQKAALPGAAEVLAKRETHVGVTPNALRRPCDLQMAPFLEEPLDAGLLSFVVRVVESPDVVEIR